MTLMSSKDSRLKVYLQKFYHNEIQNYIKVETLIYKNENHKKGKNEKKQKKLTATVIQTNGQIFENLFRINFYYQIIGEVVSFITKTIMKAKSNYIRCETRKNNDNFRH